MTCVDCGSRWYTASKSRSDVCVECMDLRQKLVEAMSAGKVTPEEFVETQVGCGQRKYRIMDVLKKVEARS